MKLNLFKRKDGKCRWWNHKDEFERREEVEVGTGMYIDGKEIKRKHFYLVYKCKKCQDIDYSDAIPV